MEPSYKEQREPKVNLSQAIYKNVQATYFPKNTILYNIFQAMLAREKQNLELQHAKERTLFEIQPELSTEMRYILLNWLNQVSADYCLKR